MVHESNNKQSKVNTLKIGSTALQNPLKEREKMTQEDAQKQILGRKDIQYLETKCLKNSKKESENRVDYEKG